MQLVFMAGRIAFVIIFLVAGVLQLVDIGGTAQIIESKVVIPAVAMPYLTNVESSFGLPPYQLLAVVASIVEIVCALFILFNIGTRFSAFVLLLFVAVVTYCMHDFWNMTGDARSANLDMAMKNLSMMGGLLMLIAVGDWRPDDGAELEEDEYAR